MQANESLVKKFGPKCHLVGIYYPYTYFQIIYKSLYVGWIGEGLLVAKKRIFQAKKVAVHLISKTKVTPY